MSTTITPNMGLVVPTVGVEPGPTWATDLNASLSILDGHNHAPGAGVQINPDGLNINSDLTFLDNNGIAFRSVRFQPQGSPLALTTDLGCLYESGVDLYYNDGAGNQVRITQSGGVAGSPGSIGGLASPASATYVAGNDTFVFQSAASTPANIDGASYILRNLTINSKGLTLNPPAAMASNFSLTLPSLPASTNIMTMTSSGVMAANVVVDNASIQLSANILSVKNGGITPAKLSAFNYTLSSSTGSFSGSAGTNQFPNCSVSITTSGRPVQVILQSISGFSNMTWLGRTDIVFKRGGSTINYMNAATNDTSTLMDLPASAFSYVDIIGAGTYTYAAFYNLVSGSFSVTNGIQLLVYEM